MNLEISYFLLTIFMVVILALIGNYAINQTVNDANQKVKKKMLLFGGLVIWQVYLFGLAFSGFLLDLSFPPRFFLFLILPAFLFTGIFLWRNRKSKWIQSIPPVWLAFYQTFRILIETLFVYTVAAGLLHKNVTIEGYNYDMVYAFTAPLIGGLILFSKQLPRGIILAWNFMGLGVIAVIITLFITTIYFPEIYGLEADIFPNEFGLYPYATVPGFLMPSAVFIHILSITQLLNRK